MIRKYLQFGLLVLSMSAGLAFAGPVNINTADAATLAAELVGVGEKTAAAIVEYREKNGAFKAASDLMSVKGIGDAVFEKNLENIRVE